MRFKKLVKLTGHMTYLLVPVTIWQILSIKCVQWPETEIMWIFSFFFRPGHDEPVVSISQALSNESQAQQIPHQQQPLQPMVFTTTASVVDPIPGDNPQLFHSTKF